MRHDRRSTELSEHSNECTFASLPEIDLDAQPLAAMKKASTFVSPWLAAEYGVVAVEVSDFHATVAIKDSRGLEGAKIIRAANKREVDHFVATPDAIARAQIQVYEESRNDISAGLRDVATLIEPRRTQNTSRESDTPAPKPNDSPTAIPVDSDDPQTAPTLLGERLCAREHLSPERLNEALRIQERTGGRIGDVLVHWELASDEAVADALAEQCRSPRTNLMDLSPDPKALSVVPQDVARRLRVMPVSLAADTLHVAVDGPLEPSTLAELRNHTDHRIWPILGTRGDLDNFYSRTYANKDERDAANSLLNRTPDESAFRVLTRPQLWIVVGFVTLWIFGLTVSPLATLVATNLLLAAIYVVCSMYKFKLVYHALGHDLELPVTSEDLAALSDRDLPTYTILVPLYRESAVVPNLIESIRALDYPCSKLDIKLITEEDDLETIATLEDMRLPAHFNILVVPEGQPRTKPKACNFGLLQARGELVVIYDAEDRPERDQLKKVVVALSSAPESIACVQCKLNFYNRNQNLLTKWFCLEYSSWFDLFMPGLDAQACPIPLGGTSNHFRRHQLLELGAWDPFNVTEDCDLGVRLHKAGYRTAIVDSTTFEEANSDLYNWVRQRSRWVKGYVQTWLVQMRHPIRLQRQVGWRSWFSLQIVLAGTFISFLVNPIFWTLNTLWILNHAGIVHAIFPASVYYVSVIGLYLGNLSFVYVNVAGALRRRFPELVKYAFISPLYWGLMSIGAWKGFLQLCTRPHYWEKTIHGLDGARPMPK